MNDDTLRIRNRLAMSKYLGEPCRICRQPLTLPDLLNGAVLTAYSRDGAARVAHRTCWDNFIELLQTLPPQLLYDLVAHGKENDGGQFTPDDRGTAL